MCLCSVGFPCWAAKQDILMSKACHQHHRSPVTDKAETRTSIQNPETLCWWSWHFLCSTSAARGCFKIYNANLMLQNSSKPNKTETSPWLILSYMHICCTCCNVPSMASPLHSIPILLASSPCQPVINSVERLGSLYTFHQTLHLRNTCESDWLIYRSNQILPLWG